MSNVLSSDYRGISLSHATLREEDLIPTFLDFLREHAPQKYAAILEDWRDCLPHTGQYDVFESDKFEQWISDEPEQASYLLNEDIWEALNDIAPRGTYFGAHPGDGSDMGFWPVEEEWGDSSTADYRYYVGDVNLEYGGFFVNLDNWRYCYADVLRVTDLDSGCGFTGAVLVERLTVFGWDDREKVKNALRCCGWDRIPGTAAESRKLALVDALLSYGYYDPDSYSPRLVIQTDSDADYAPMTFDGWTAEVRLSEAEDLLEYLESEGLLSDFE
jgi:hypothetical protein